MAARTEGYEILFHIITQQAARLNVMNLKICTRTTALATPSVAFQDRPVKFPI
jgi:hypothetical protein